MNILLLVQGLETARDFGSDRMFFFCKYFVDSGHDVSVITGNVDYKTAAVKFETPRRSEMIDGVHVRYVYAYANFRGSFKKRFWYYLTYLASALVEGLRGPRPDIIYAASTPLTVGLLGYLLSRLRGVPFVFEVSDVWPDAAVAVGVVTNTRVIAAARALELFCYRKAERILALTRGIKDNIVAKGVPPDKIVLITNGFDPSLFPERAQPDARREQARRQLGMDARFVCLYLGAHGAYNALGTIIEAARTLRDDPQFLFVFVGDGDDKLRLQEQVRHDRLENVTFLPPVPRHQSPDVLRTADVCLLPNRRGEFFNMNLPNKLFDFLATEVPIIVAGSGESADVVRNAGAGVVVPAEDGVAMAGAIRTLARAGAAERAAMGASGRRYALEHYDRNTISRTLLATLLDVRTQRGVAGP